MSPFAAGRASARWVRRPLAPLLALAAFGFGAASVQAQPTRVGSSLSVGALHAEFRGGITVGSHTGSYAALDIAPALSFDVTLVREVAPALSAFAGFYRTAFGCEEGYCKDRDVTVIGNHGGVGAEWRFRAARLRGGVLVGTTSAGSLGEDPKVGLGLQFGGGLSVGVGRYRFLPGFSYRWLTAATQTESDQAVALSLDLGVGIRLGGGE